MTIDATQRKAVASGQTLTAKYKGTQHTAKVVAGDEGKLLYRLGDGREFKSPSSAGSAVMGGTACNGWRFWSIDGGTPRPAPKATAKPAKTATKKPAATAKPAPKPSPVRTARPAARRAKSAPAARKASA